MARLTLNKLTKGYGSRRGVFDLDLATTDGEFVVLFGPAGAGKTTTLNLIAGLIPPSAGSVWIGDRDASRLGPAERNVAMVFESYALYPQMSVYDNIAFPLRSPRFRTPESDIRLRVNRLAQSMGIAHLLDRPIHALSNGQRQRTALGRAMVRNPDVFLLDEPLSHLDAKLRHSMRAELKEMRSQLDATTIYVTHDYLEALSLGDRIVVLSEGRVLQTGTPDEVYFQPATTEVARFLGDPEINLLEVSVEDSSVGAVARLFPSSVPGVLPNEVSARFGKDRSKAIVGFRPNDVKLTSDGHNRAIPGRVYSFEALGARIIVTIEAEGGRKVRALLHERTPPAMGERIHFEVPAESLLFFDAQTHALLAPRNAAGTGGSQHG